MVSCRCCSVFRWNSSFWSMNSRYCVFKFRFIGSHDGLRRCLLICLLHLFFTRVLENFGCGLCIHRSVIQRSTFLCTCTVFLVHVWSFVYLLAQLSPLICHVVVQLGIIASYPYLPCSRSFSLWLLCTTALARNPQLTHLRNRYPSRILLPLVVYLVLLNLLSVQFQLFFWRHR